VDTAQLADDSVDADKIDGADASDIRTLLDVPSNAEAILDSLIDAKGDLIVGTAADTAARLAVGATNGMVLTVASGQAGGRIDALPPGFELAYVEFTSPLSVTATVEGSAQSVVSAGAVSFDGSTRVKIEFFSPDVLAGSTAASFTILNLWDGSSDIGRLGVIGHSALVTGIETPFKLDRYLTPSNASHTYSIRAWRVASDGTVSAGAGGAATQLPGFIRITKA
jgi:hypothetical protein